MLAISAPRRRAFIATSFGGRFRISVVKLVSSFTEKALPDIVKDLGDGIEWLAKEVEKPEFVSEVESLVSMIGSLATAFGGMLGGLARFARWLGVDTPGGPTINPSHVQASSPSASEKYDRESTGKGYGTHGAVNDQFTGVPHARGGTGAASSAATGTSGGGGSARGGESAEVVAYIRQAAIARGINPDTAVAAARSEGLRGFDPSKGHWSTGYNDAGTSWGVFQSHIHSNIRGQTAYGVGDDELRAGIDPRRMENWKRDIEYNLDRAARKHSWRDWHGMNRRPADEGLQGAHAARQKVSVNSQAGGNVSLSSGAAAAGAA